MSVWHDFIHRLDGAALLFGKPVDTGGKSLIDEQRLAPTHGMGAYDGMRCLRKDLAAIVATHQHIGRTIDVRTPCGLPRRAADRERRGPDAPPAPGATPRPGGC